jgi:hypothetical protein
MAFATIVAASGELANRTPIGTCSYRTGAVRPDGVDTFAGRVVELAVLRPLQQHTPSTMDSDRTVGCQVRDGVRS